MRDLIACELCVYNRHMSESPAFVCCLQSGVVLELHRTADGQIKPTNRPFSSHCDRRVHTETKTNGSEEECTINFKLIPAESIAIWAVESYGLRTVTVG